MPLTPKQQRFVAEYLIDLNASQAAIRAGYSPKTAGALGHQVLKKLEVQEAIHIGQRAQLDAAGLTATRWREEVRRLAFSDLRTVFDAQGSLKPIHELTDDEAAAVSGVEVIIKNAAAGDGHTDTVHKIKLWDKLRALDLAGKHLGLLEENASISGTIELVWGVPKS